MLLLKVLGLVFATQQTLLSAQLPLQLKCWDGTFAYNAISVVEQPDGFEVHVKGAGMFSGIELDNYHELYRGREWASDQLYLKFPRSACLVTERSIRCFDEQPIFIGRAVSDLGGAVDVISKFSGYSITMEAGDNVSIQIARDHSDTMTTSFVARECTYDGRSSSGGTNWGGDLGFPRRLREHLAQVPST